ncbi:MAG: hypothetical protein MJ107_07495 [Lachnospiraceae bacterium]|nr:hypothetical protein [Lachnospiraceae bacterium]
MSKLSSFSVSCNKTNAMIYISNMIVGSYYKADAKNDKVMNRLKIDYSLLGNKDQLAAEETVIKKMEALDVNCLKKMESLRYSLKIEPCRDKTVLWFRTGFEEIICLINDKGNLVGLYPVKTYTDLKFREFLTEILKMESDKKQTPAKTVATEAQQVKGILKRSTAHPSDTKIPTKTSESEA